MEQPRLPLALVLGLAVVAISSSAVLFRGLGDFSPSLAAMWRLTFAALCMLPFARRLTRGQLWRVALAALLLATHFTLWFASLQHTTVLRSTALVCLAPLWAGLSEWLLGGTRLHAAFWWGLALAILGVAGPGLLESSPWSWQGDGFALLGGACSALYLVLGRKVRAEVSNMTYGAWVCGIAALWLWPLTLSSEGAAAWALSGPQWGLLLALALGPQILGHMSLNYALRWMTAGQVASLTLLEPGGAALLAFLFLSEVPELSDLLGSLAAVMGVVLCTYRPEESSPGSAGGGRT